MKGLVTYSSRQSLNSFKASKEAFQDEKIYLELIHFEEFPRNYFSSFRKDLKIILRLIFNKYDFIILNSGASLLVRPLLLASIVFLSKFKSSRTYVLWRNASEKFEKCRSKVGNSFYTLAKKSISSSFIRHLVISPQTAEAVSAELNIDYKYFRCIGNCQKVPELYCKCIQPDDPPIIINVGNVIPRKDPGVFIEIAERVCSKHLSARFIWIGGQLNGSLLETLKKSVHYNRISFLPFSDNPFEWMQRSSLLFLTSRTEGFGLVAAEAMACSRTVFCFDGTGTSFAIGSTGVIIPQGNVDLAVEKILNLINLPAHLRINQEAHLRYSDMFSPKAYAKTLKSILARDML